MIIFTVQKHAVHMRDVQQSRDNPVNKALFLFLEWDKEAGHDQDEGLF